MFEKIKTKLMTWAIISYLQKEGNVIGKFKAFFVGKKTYLVCVSAILTAVIAYSNGAIELSTLVKSIFEALAGITVRASIK